MQTGSSTDCYINNFAHPVVVLVRVVTFIKCIRIPASSWSAFITHSSAVVIVFRAIVVISTHPSSSASPHSPSMPSLRSYFGPCCCIRVIQFLHRFAASGVACSGCCSSLRQALPAVAAGPIAIDRSQLGPRCTAQFPPFGCFGIRNGAGENHPGRCSLPHRADLQERIP